MIQEKDGNMVEDQLIAVELFQLRFQQLKVGGQDGKFYALDSDDSKDVYKYILKSETATTYTFSVTKKERIRTDTPKKGTKRKGYVYSNSSNTYPKGNANSDNTYWYVYMNIT